MTAITEVFQLQHQNQKQLEGADRISVIMLDFDGTLFPTTHQQQEGWTGDSDSNVDRYLLSMLDGVVKVLLQLSQSLSSANGAQSLFIVTNATLAHIKETTENFLHETHLLIEDWGWECVVSARDSYGSKSHFFQWKCDAFFALIKKISEEDSGKGQINLISIGDSEWERSAAFWVKSQLPSIVGAVKSVQLVPDTELCGLVEQLHFIVDKLPSWVASDFTIDVKLQVFEPSALHSMKYPESSTNPTFIYEIIASPQQFTKEIPTEIQAVPIGRRIVPPDQLCLFEACNQAVQSLIRSLRTLLLYASSAAGSRLYTAYSRRFLRDRLFQLIFVLSRDNHNKKFAACIPPSHRFEMASNVAVKEKKKESKSSYTFVDANLRCAEGLSSRDEDHGLKLAGSLVHRIASSLHIILGLAQFLGDIPPPLKRVAIEWASEVLRTT